LCGEAGKEKRCDCSEPGVRIYLAWKFGYIKGQGNVTQVPPSYIHRINVKTTFQTRKGRRGEIV